MLKKKEKEINSLPCLFQMGSTFLKNNLLFVQDGICGEHLFLTLHIMLIVRYEGPQFVCEETGPTRG